MKKIEVPLKERSYSVIMGKNILLQFPKEIHKRNITGKILVITDQNVDYLYRKQIAEMLSRLSNQVEFLVLKAGEDSKSPEALEQIYSFMIEKNFGRDSLIIAFGGGIVGDISGYAAATYMRGIPYVQVPTTLLADVDSSVGGKTGINFNHTKNVIGAFNQPLFVLIDLEFLNTLPYDEMLCGAGEIIKYAFLSTPVFYNYVNKNISSLLDKNEKVLSKTVHESVSIKASIVTADEKESGLRKILNLGHTFAHGFESITNYKIKHGEAVIAGIGCSLFLSRKLGIIEEPKFQSFLQLINKSKLNFISEQINKNDFLNIMLKDKKNRSGKIKFVLVKDIGQILIDVEAGEEDIFYSLAEYEKVQRENSYQSR